MSNLIQAFGQSPYVSAIANAIQIASGLAAVLAWWHLSCRVPWCWRHGQHPVEGTSWKVCSHHHEFKHHEWLRFEHSKRHPGRLKNGES